MTDESPDTVPTVNAQLSNFVAQLAAAEMQCARLEERIIELEKLAYQADSELATVQRLGFGSYQYMVHVGHARSALTKALEGRILR